MSFTTEVKSELCSSTLTKKQARIVLYGFLYALRDGGTSGFYSENAKVAEFVAALCSRAGTKITNKRKNGSWGYMVQFAGVGGALRGIDVFSPLISTDIVGGSDDATGFFLRGVFLACGVVSDPNSQYHLEFSVPADEKCDRLFTLITESGMRVKKSSRKGQPFLYTKDSEGISDILTFIGAMISSMEIMNAKIYKDLRNNVNRTVNCEAANIAKTVAAGTKQAEDVEFILSVKGVDFLDEDLRELALIRKDNPDKSLRELGELLTPPISRSGVNHRLKRISELADKLRSEK